MKIYLVGGAVRDKLLHREITERDYVVVGATVADMLKLGYRQVGKEFPVFLHPDTAEEYALARMERKVKPGYTGFAFDTSPDVSIEDDLLRRDLTINAMAEESGHLIDPFHGQQDIAAKILRHVSPAFAEDPVRILRIGRFLARFAHLGFSVAPETIELMRNMVTLGEVDALVAERVWKELERALGEGNPEKFFEVLHVSGALPILFPHLTIDGPGIRAIEQATALTPHPPIRFAVLFYALPEDSEDKSQNRKMINELCHRYRVPNSFRELAILVAEYWEKAVELSARISAREEVDRLADHLLRLFTALDIYRREERFHDFLISCNAIASSKQLSFRADALLNAGSIARSVKYEEVRDQVTNEDAGMERANKMNERRKQKLVEFLRQ